MQIYLRPHHLLCLKGYKGQNYNKIQVNRWGIITKLLKEYPDADILIKTEKDDLCSKCPAASLAGKSICKESAVKELDEKVKNFLGLVDGQVYKYSEVMKKLMSKMTREQHEKWCSFCAWWKKGLCRDSFPPADKK